MRTRFHSASGAVLTAVAAAVFCSGAARAQVFDGAAGIDDRDDADASALLVNADTTAYVRVEKVCVEGEDSVLISSFSTHPDKTKVDDPSAQVEQGRKGNLPDIVVEGSGTMEFEVALDCEKAEVAGKAKLDKSKGKFGIKAKNCSGLSSDQLTYVLDVCATAQNTKIKADGTRVKKLKVKGKGPASSVEL